MEQGNMILTTIVYWGYFGIMGQKTEITIRGPASLTHVPQALQSKSGEDFQDP